MHLYEKKGREANMQRRSKVRVVFIVAGVVITAFGIFLALGTDRAIAADSKEIFANSCSSCHGKTGKGDGIAAAALNPKPKDLTDKAYVSKLDDGYLLKIISKGGAAVGKSPLMPPFGGNLKEQDVQKLITFIRSLAK